GIFNSPEMMHFFVYLFAVRLICAINIAEQSEQSEQFWIDAGLLSIVWKQGCLTTGGCADPRFRIIEIHSVTNEKIAVGWPITENLVEEHSRLFVSHWNKGTPEDLSISCEVAGTDPTYGFPRTCDSSPAIRLFQMSTENIVAIEGAPPSKGAKKDSESEKTIAELRGKCFNATIAVQKHTIRCPWCPDPSTLAVVEQQYSGSEPPIELAQQIASRDQLLHIGVILLSAIAIVSSTAFTCLLIAFLKQKRSNALLNKQRRFGAYHEHCQQVHVDQFQSIHADESRYETPWDQKYRPLPYWLGNRNDMTTVSPPIETSSIIGGGTLSGHTSRTTVIGTVGRHHASPNSSVGDRHEDSGLESV
uniref:C2 domain-containing protein n=1 Tax=Parascaris univalens TaxID=6257 RepID=A0A915AKH5_PARUN